MNRETVTEDMVARKYDLAAETSIRLALLVRESANRQMTDNDAQELATLVQQSEALVSSARSYLVMHLRDAGASWAMVGGVLGISRQSAHERFEAYDRE